MPVAGCGRCGRTLPTGPVCPTSLGPTNTAETITETLNRAEAGQLGYLDFLDQILAEEISVKDSRRFRYPLLGIGQEPPGGGNRRDSSESAREPRTVSGADAQLPRPPNGAAVRDSRETWVTESTYPGHVGRTTVPSPLSCDLPHNPVFSPHIRAYYEER